MAKPIQYCKVKKLNKKQLYMKFEFWGNEHRIWQSKHPFNTLLICMMKKLYCNSHLCLYVFYSSPPPTPTSFKVFSCLIFCSLFFSLSDFLQFEYDVPKCGFVFVWLFGYFVGVPVLFEVFVLSFPGHSCVVCY